MGSKTGAKKVAAKRTGASAEDWERRRASGQHWCYLCKQWLSISLFNADRSRSNGLTSCCRPCIGIKSAASRYGLTIERVREIRAGSLPCDICEQVLPLEIDHDHGTGKIRGILCRACNKGIGMFANSSERLLKTIEYLEKSRESDND